MKTIKISLNDKLIEELKNDLDVKKLCGNFHGNIDEFCYLIITNILKKEKSITIIKKG